MFELTLILGDYGVCAFVFSKIRDWLGVEDHTCSPLTTVAKEGLCT